MANIFGRASKEMYNENLMALYDSLKNLHSVVEPVDAPEGALWIDKDALKVKRKGAFELLYDEHFQSMAKIVSSTYPSNPKPGQMWIDEGALIYYDGIKWKPVKALALEDFSMDGFEPFLIIDSIQAGENVIVKKQYDIIEEEFIGSKGSSAFVLQKGSYTPSTNKISVYLNGRLLPKSKTLEFSPTEIRLVDVLTTEERIVVQYIPTVVEQNLNYFPLRFHPNLREEVVTILEDSFEIYLPSEVLSNIEYTMVYINGRFIPRKYYSIESNRVIKISSQLKKDDEVIIQYIDSLETSPLPEGDIKVVEAPTYSQYLWPSTEYDKLFMNGKLNLQFETINKVSIQYPTDDVQGKQLSAVHIHPRNLCNIEKRVYAFEKAEPFIQCDETYTEFYGLKLDNKIDDSQLERSHLYANLVSALLEDGAAQKSFIFILEENTSYTIKRRVNSNEFKIIECASLPIVDAAYSKIIDLSSQPLDYTYSYTPSLNTKYIILQMGSNTENWYAPIISSNKDSYKSKLLIKTSRTDSDYVSSIGGIVLNTHIAQEYDYILAVHYVFAETIGRGVMAKKSFLVTEDSQILIGHITDPLLLFAQGHYLIPENNYLYDQNAGIITLLFPEQLDIGVITFPRHEAGIITEINNEKKGIIIPQKQMSVPLIFVYGQQLQQLVDFEVVNNVYYVPNAKINMHYAIVDCLDLDGSNMLVSKGTLTYDELKQNYYVATSENFDEIVPILFVDGLLINKKDTYFENGRLYLKNGGTLTSGYTLLKDLKNKFLHSDIKHPGDFIVNIPASQSMLYIDGNVVNDIESVGVVSLPAVAYENEIKALIKYDVREGYLTDGWYIYKKTGWEPLTDIAAIEKMTIHYVLENKSLHFQSIAPFLNKECSGWFYQFDNHIEYPLMCDYVMTSTEKKVSIYQHHAYLINQNTLSVFINGYRQYPKTLLYPGIKELDRHQFELPEAIADHVLDYIVELPEKNETKSCDFFVAVSTDIDNRTLRSPISLLPGHVVCYIDGIRQPQSSFEIIDAHTLYFPEFVKDERYINKFLIEYRKDMYIKEASEVLKFDSQYTFKCEKELTELIYSKDFVKIFFNGLFLGKSYQIDYTQNAIAIPGLKHTAKKGDTIIFEWR